MIMKISTRSLRFLLLPLLTVAAGCSTSSPIVHTPVQAQIQLSKTEPNNDKQKDLIVFSILAESSGGIRALTLTAINLAKKTAQVVQTIQEPETEFLSCWKEVLHTEASATMEAVPLLETCVHKLRNKDVAALMLELDDAEMEAKQECLENGEGHYERVRNCWADPSHRLIQGAHSILFQMATKPEYLQGKKISFDELAR